MNSRRFVFGVRVSFLWVIAGAILLYLKRGDLGAMTPNAWGDFFAGLFAPRFRALFLILT